jgi:hypothetical protein
VGYRRRHPVPKKTKRQAFCCTVSSLMPKIAIARLARIIVPRLPIRALSRFAWRTLRHRRRSLLSLSPHAQPSQPIRAVQRSLLSPRCNSFQTLDAEVWRTIPPGEKV